MNTETMETPRTDEAIAKSNGQWSYELRDLCRQLERELAEAKAQRDDAIVEASSEDVKDDPHKFCRGGGGNNFHCGCKYDS